MKPNNQMRATKRTRLTAPWALMLVGPAVFLALATPTALAEEPEPSQERCEYANYGVFVGTYSCEANGNNTIDRHDQYCDQRTGAGAGAGAGGPGENGAQASAGAGANCTNGGSDDGGLRFLDDADRVVSKDGLLDLSKEQFGRVVEFVRLVSLG